MKTNLFTHRISTFGKRLVMLITMLLVVGVNSVWGATWEKATSIAAGDVVLLVCESQKMELSGISTTNTKYGIGTAYSTTPAGLYELTVEAGSTSGTYSFKNGSNYLYWTSGNSLATNTAKSAKTSWTVIFSNGNATIKNGSDATRVIGWNASSPRFACYTSSQTAVQLYKKVTTALTYTITAQSNNTNYGTVSLSGTTITATPKTGYRVSTTTPYTISPSGSATVTQNGNTFTITPSANTTITINFEALPKYTVTLKDDNSTLTQSTAGATITLPSRDGCDGYEFVGWTKSWSVAQTTWTTTAPTIIPDGSYTPTANESLYPVYTKTEGGTPVPATLKASYTSYSGWTATNCGGSSYWVLKSGASITSPVISDLSTVTSITFKVRTYGGASYNTVNVSTNGGTSIGSASASSTTLTLKTINVSPKLSGSGSIVFSSNTTSSSYGPGINEITINYSTGGSTTSYISVTDCGTPITPTQLDAPTNLNETNITSTSATLSWDAVANASSYVVTVVDGGAYSETFTTTSPSINITGLTAETDYLWTVQAIGDGTHYTNSEESETGEFTTIFSGYTITYETDGGDAIASVVAMALPDPLPTAKRTHYTFEGWYTDAELTTAAVAGATLNADITLYAKWTPKVYLTILHPQDGVLLDTNGTQQDSIIIEHVYNTSAVDIPVANYYQSITRDGYKFKGWYNAPSEGSKWLNIAQGKNQNLWAQWLEERTVTYYSIGQVYDTQTYGNGETLTLPTTDPTACDGYTFVGWASDEQIGETTTCPTLVSASTQITADETFYAVWKKADGSGDGLYHLVTDVAELQIGSSIVIAASASDYAISTTQNTNNRGQAAITKDDTEKTLSFENTAGVQELTLKEGTTTGTYAFYTGSGYLYAASSSKNYLKTETTPSANSSWKITITSAGVATCTAQGTNTHNVLKYNSSSSLFSCYESGQNDIAIYQLSAGTTLYTTSPNCCPVNLEKPQVTYSVADGAVTLNWTMVNNESDVADYTVACVGGETHTTTATSYTFTGLTNCAEYTFTVKANGDGTDVCSSGVTAVTATPAAGSFTVTFDYGAGEGTPTQWTSGCANGTSTTLPTPTTLPDNHTFEGWYDGTNLYVAGDNYTPTSDVTLYARYTRNTAVDVVEWDPDAITIEVNTEGSAQVQIENQTTHGSSSNIADNLFFSKYYESTRSVKLLAVFNGTAADVDLSKFRIRMNAAKASICSGTSTWSSTITLSGTLEQGKEYILYEDGNDDKDKEVMACVQENHADELATWNLNTNVNFSGNDAVILEQNNGSSYEIIDIIGAGTNSAANLGSTCDKGVVNAVDFMDDPGWYNAAGESIEDGSTIALSTTRCLLVRKSTVKSGAIAVAKNITDFVTLGGEFGEWIGKQIPNGSDNGVQASCDGFDFVGTFNYGGYYQTYDSLTRIDLGGNQNADGTYTIPVPQLDTLSCTKMRIQVLDNNGASLASSEYKVPIMVKSSGITTTDELFSKHGIEGCRDCDVVVLKNATLQKASDGTANDMPEVRDMEVYAGGKLVVPNGTNYTMRKLVMRSKGDEVPVAEIDGTAVISDKLYHAKRIDAQKFYFFTLPYDCAVSDITYYNGEVLGARGIDYVIKYYDGEGRANGQNAGHWEEFTGATLKAGVGYILAVDASLNGDFDDNPKKEFLFPMTKTLTETSNKTVAVGTWGIGDATIGDNHKGWNLVGAPFMSNYNPISATGLKVGTYEDGDWNDAGTIFTYNNSVTVPYVTMPNTDGKTYTQKLASAQDLEPFKSFFIQVGKEGEIITDVAFSSSERLSKVVRRAPEVDATLWIELELENSVDSDVTTIIVDEDKSSAYEIGSDLEKMIGYAQKPQFYSLQTNTRLAFNALSSSIASVAIPLGFFAPEADTYTISLNTEDTQNIEGVYLTDKTTGAVTNLLFDDYNFSSARVLNDNRFSVAIVRAVTSVDNLLAEDSVAPFVHNRDLWINNAPIGSVLYVFDMLGREVISEQINKETLVYHLHMAGVYHVQIVSKDKKSVYKVVSY